MRSTDVLHAMPASPPATRAPVAVAANETILECGQTTSVSMPSALFGEAGIGAGPLLKRAGTVKERRALCSGVGACSGVLEGASGEDMVGGSCRHFEIRGVVLRVIRSYFGRCSCRAVVILSTGRRVVRWEAEKPRALSLTLGATCEFHGIHGASDVRHKRQMLPGPPGRSPLS